MAAFMTMMVGFILAVAIFAASLVGAISSVRWAAIGYTAAIYAVLAIVLVSCASVRAPEDPMGIRLLKGL
jgi:hypothetical protein